MRVIFSEAAKADIRAILLETREKFGPMQVPRYRALISEARQRLQQMPTLGHHREGMPQEARLFHISQPGRSASHFFLFRVDDTEGRIEVVAGCGGMTTHDVAHRDTPTAGAKGSEPTTGGTAGMDAGTGEGGRSGTVGSGGGMDLTPAGFPRCGQMDPNRADDCAGIELIKPRVPPAGSNLAGWIGIGESGPVSVWVQNGDSVAHDNVCVGVAVDTPGITLTPYENTNPMRVGMLSTSDIAVTVTPVYFHVGRIEPGTAVRFTAWTTYEGTNCAGPTATADGLVR